MLVPEDSAGCRQHARGAQPTPRCSAPEVEIPGNGKRKARTASVEVRVAQVTIKPPQRRGAQRRPRARSSRSRQRRSGRPSTIRARGKRGDQLGAADEPARQGLRVAPARRSQWYGKRWGIETWHKVLKSGCKVEDCLLEAAERLKRYLTLFSIIGVRLMHVAYLARAQPELPATEVFPRRRSRRCTLA